LSTTRTKAIHIEAHIFPTSLQDTLAGEEEVKKVHDFIQAVEAAAAKFMPHAGHEIKITEERVSETRGGR
jgi:hypothetical protein